MEREIKKNLLDLKYNKYLQYYNTSIIILFTYFIGLALAIITKQVDYTNYNHLFFILGITFFVCITIIYFMLKFKTQLSRIPKQIANLAVNTNQHPT